MSNSDSDKNKWRGKSKMAHAADNRSMTGRDKRGYMPPVRATLWCAGWDKKCKADFAEYVHPINPRLVTL